MLAVDVKFFVGFNKKYEYEIIVSLQKDGQQKAVTKKGITPFGHVAKTGWIEINMKSVEIDSAFNWIKKGYEYALSLPR